MTKKPITIKNLSTLRKNKNSIPEHVVDQWVNMKIDNFSDIKDTSQNSSEIIEETRLTILIPTYLHRRIKKYCAGHSLSMKEKIIQIFKENFPEN